MNITPAALNALAVAEEIGIFAGQVSTDVPSIPLDDIVNGVVVAAAAAATATATTTATITSPSAPSTASTLANGSIDGVDASASATTNAGGTATTSTSTNVDGSVDVDGAATSTDSVLGYVIEGIDALDPHVKRHAVAFYNWLIPKFQEASAQFFIIDRAKYHKIIYSLKRVEGGESLSSLRPLFPNIHHWNKKYVIVDDGVGGHSLVSRPEVMLDEMNVESNELKRITYLERVFSDLLTAHGVDHRQGRTLYASIGEICNNVPRDVCKMFTDLCPRCIQRHKRNRPVAGLRPIITNGFNVRGQVDLVDFQSMPDGEFRFLLNYIDHGIKFLFSIPIVRKRASCIAIALLQIFTIIGPPMILQSDNGSEFHGAALNARLVTIVCTVVLFSLLLMHHSIMNITF